MSDPISLARTVERALGDARDPRLLFSFARRVAEDEAEVYPAEALRRLLELGLHRYDVPVELGGGLRRLDQLGALVRVVSRRDLTVAIGHAISFLGAAAVWIAGREDQRRAVAREVLAGERISVALTETEFGSDLLGMTTSATMVDGAVHLRGEKWLGNGIARNRFALVYARTSPPGGPRGFGLVLVDRDLAGGGFRPLPRTPTLGIRGADVRGVALDAVLPSDAIVGRPDAGFETILKGLQLTRTLCGQLVLGALDTALDVVLRFAGTRRVYGKPVEGLPQCRRLLAEAWAEQLVVDALTRSALRALQVVPEQASLHSAVVKALAPGLAEQAMAKLTTIYGARSFLRDAHEAGVFQKIQRDHLLIGIFDGSTQVNLYSLLHQLRSVAARGEAGGMPEWLSARAPLPDFDWQRLSLSAGGCSALFGAFDAGVDALRGSSALAPGTTSRGWLLPRLERLVQGKAELLETIRGLGPAAVATGAPEAFEAARRFCAITAAACVLAAVELDRDRLAPTLADPAVLAVALDRLAGQLGPGAILPGACYDQAFAALQAQRAHQGETGEHETGADAAPAALEQGAIA